MGTMVGNMMDEHIQPMVCNCTNEVLEESLRKMRAEFSTMVTQRLATAVPQQIESCFQNYMQTHVDIPSDTCRPDAFRKRDHDDHSDNPYEGEKGSKRQNIAKGKEEDLMTQVLEKPTPVYQGCERDPNAPERYLYNKDLFYLKHGNSMARKYVLSLHKIHVVPFSEDDLEELLTRWVGRVYKKFNEEARLSISIGKAHGVKIAKKERRVMDIDELQKFYDATLERVLKNVKEITMEARHGFKYPPERKR
ncbi:hypothetical protein Tco_0483634 [Tanacetum coccineum]